jgi:D-alanine-D-alanine ligase
MILQQTSQHFGQVAVLFGGQSSERAISLRSGQAVYDALKRLNIDAQAIDPDRQVMTLLQQGRFDRVLIMLHGRGGEDGRLQGALESIGMPYTGSGVLGSAIAMDKVRTKWVWTGAGLPHAAFIVVRDQADVSTAAQLGFPLMVKPATEGSSLGVTRVDNESALFAAWQTAAAYDRDVMIESWLPGPEYTCAILGDQALPLIRLETPHTFYDFNAKYSATTTHYHCPCGLDSATERSLQKLCVNAFSVIGATGWGRVDFMFDAAGNPQLLEVNTVPGMTDHSLVPMAAQAAGIDFDQLVLRILETSLVQGS